MLTSLSMRNAAHLTFRRWKTFLFVMLVPPAVCAAVVLPLKSQYESNASVMVKIVDQEVVAPDMLSEQQGRSALSAASLAPVTISAALVIMTSRDVYKTAIDRVGVHTIYPDIEKLAAKEHMPVLDLALEKLEKDFTVKASGDTNVLMLAGFNTDAVVAQTLLKTLIKAAVEKQASVMRDPRKDFLDQKLASLGKEADVAKQALAQFKRRTQITSFDEERTLLLRQRDDIQLRLGQTRAELVSAQGRSGVLQDSLNRTPEQIALADESDRFNVAFQTAQQNLNTARAQYENAQQRFPIGGAEIARAGADLGAAERAFEQARRQSTQRGIKGISPLAQQLSGSLSTARSDANASRGAVKERERQLEDINKRLAFLDESEIELRDLERKQNMAEASYKSYLQRAQSAQIVSDMNEAGISGLSVVQQPSLAYKTSRPKKGLLIGIAVFGGILAAFGLCLLLETMDSTLSLPEHVESALGLPVLASIRYKKFR